MFPTVYEIPKNVLTVIRFTNILLAIAVILSSTLIYAFIVNNSEKVLENKVEKKSQEVIEIHKHTVDSLANLVESRDSDTGEHIQRISKYVEYIATSAMKKGLYKETLTESFISLLNRAAPLHDIGKIVIADEILKKPARLTIDEFEIIKTHTVEGKKIVRDIVGISNDEDYIKIAEEIALSHHERWDGKGYPQGLKAEEIPLSARILAIADVFDALISERCYKPAYTIDEAYKIIKEEAGSHFDPILAELFIEVREEFLRGCGIQKN